MGRASCAPEHRVDLARGLDRAHPPLLLGEMLRAQDLPALAAASREDRASSARGHPCTKPMCLRPLADVWLVSTLHLSSSSCADTGAKPNQYRRRACHMSNRNHASWHAGRPASGKGTGIGDDPIPRHSENTPQSVDNVENAGFALVEPVDIARKTVVAHHPPCYDRPARKGPCCALVALKCAFQHPICAVRRP